MTRKHILVAAPLAALLLCGWGCVASPGPDGPGSPRTRNPPARRAAPSLLEQMKVAVQQACACKNRQCVQQAYRTLDFLMDAIGTKRPPDATKNVLMSLVARARRCGASVPKERAVAVRPVIDPANPLVLRVRALRKECCACRDRRCAKRMSANLMSFVQSANPTHLGQATRLHISRLALEALTCVNKLINAPRPSTIP